jgi:3-deoxy-D-manno-octulosonic-acid transferase
VTNKYFLALILYRLIYSILKTLLIIFSQFRQSSKWAKAIRLKSPSAGFATQKDSVYQGLTEADLRRLRPFWIHAASGEFEYAKPLLRELKKNFPHVPILVTYTSPSALSFLVKNEDLDFYLACPWDQPAHLSQFLTAWNPRALMIARTDAWPEMLYQTHLAKVPSLLFSASFHPSQSLWKRLSFLLSKWSYVFLKNIYVVHPSDQSTALDLLGLSSEVHGDSRYDQVQFRLKHQQKIKTELQPKFEDLVFIAGSTWPLDEEKIFPFIVKNKNLKLILAPHEVDPQHIHQIKEKLNSFHLQFICYSDASDWGPQQQVLIIDQVGILAELYLWAQFAFVGGSFVKKVHSVMEPLAAGLPVLVGPHYQNNREAIEFSRITVNELLLVTRVQTSEDFDDFIKKYHHLSREQKISLRNEIRSQILARTGATEKILSWVKANAF